MRSAFTLFAAFFTVLAASAQILPEPSTYAGTPTPDLILRWLRSQDPRLQTWAAHDILVFQIESLIPILQSQLDRSASAIPPVAQPDNSRFVFAILDTLIQLNATVPAAVLDRVHKLGYGSSVEEIVLLARLPWEEAEPAIRSFYQPRSETNLAETRVAAQMLVNHPQEGFAVQLLSTIVVSAVIVVRDPGIGNGFGSGWAACCGMGASLLDQEWPEIGRYAFLDPPRNHQPPPESDTLFLPAPDPIYLRRIVSRNYYARPCGGFASLNDSIRSHLVGTLLGGDPASPFPEQIVTVDIPFQSRESYHARVQTFVDEQEQNFAQVANALTSRYLLTEEERQAAALHLDLSLQDLRTQPAPDLPTLTFRPPVKWLPNP